LIYTNFENKERKCEELSLKKMRRDLNLETKKRKRRERSRVGTWVRGQRPLLSGDHFGTTLEHPLPLAVHFAQDLGHSLQIPCPGGDGGDEGLPDVGLTWGRGSGLPFGQEWSPTSADQFGSRADHTLELRSQFTQSLLDGGQLAGDLRQGAQDCGSDAIETIVA
jgi:hypothetical protein